MIACLPQARVLRRTRVFEGMMVATRTGRFAATVRCRREHRE